MSLAVSVRDSRDRIAVLDQEDRVILWADLPEAQELIKRQEVDTIRRKGRIYALRAKPHVARAPQKPTPIRQHGTMGDSHTNLRECRCALCREAGAPIKEHLNRSTNPAGVWTIDALPRWGKGDWKTRALFRRPVVEAVYGREHVERCLKASSKPVRSRTASRSKAA